MTVLKDEQREVDNGEIMMENIIPFQFLVKKIIIYEAT